MMYYSDRIDSDQQEQPLKRSRPGVTSHNSQELSRQFCKSSEAVLRNLDIKDECRKQIIVYVAASQLVTLNIEETQCGDHCGLCLRAFLADSEKRKCLAHLHARLAAFEDQKKNLNKIIARRCSANVRIDLKAAINFPLIRKGYSSYIKQVKTTCLTKKNCPACKRIFPPSELGRFLSRLDRWSRDLHSRSLQEEEDEEEADKENMCPNRATHSNMRMQ